MCSLKKWFGARGRYGSAGMYFLGVCTYGYLLAGLLAAQSIAADAPPISRPSPLASPASTKPADVLPGAPAAPPTTMPGQADGMKQVGRITDPAISECSGLVASRQYPGIFWTHNDSGNPPVLFAIDGTGKTVASFPVAGRNTDWEDIAIDSQGRIYLADIGNNSRKRMETQVLCVAEPDPHAPLPAGATDRPALQVEREYRLRTPGSAFDAESLFIWKSKGYIFSKNLDGSPATLYSFDLDARPGNPQMLQVVATVPIRVPVTGADISPDGSQLAIQTVMGPRLVRIDGNPAAAATAPITSQLFFNASLEAICFTPDGLMGASEDRLVIDWSLPSFGPESDVPVLPARRQIHIQPAPEKAMVDGDLSEWTAAPGAEITLRDGTEVAPADEENPLLQLQQSPSSQPQVTPAAGAPLPTSARLWCGWKTDGLVIATRVPAEKVRPLREFWFTGDCIEMYFGSDEAHRALGYAWGDFRCYAGFEPSKVGVESNGEGGGDSLGAMVMRFPFMEDRVPAGVKISGHVNADGTYQAEMFIPAELLNQAIHPTWPAPEERWIVNPQSERPSGKGFEAVRLPGPRLVAGDHLRMEVSILGRQPARNWFLSTSNAAGTWMTPLLWSSVTLDDR